MIGRLKQRISDRTATVGVIGLGYVGLPLAVTIASRGFPTIGFDIDASKIEVLGSGQSYIEAVTDEALQQVAGNTSFTADFARLRDCDVITICVPTPLSRYREPDLSFVEQTARIVAQNLTSETLIVLESTTYPGTTREVLVPLLAESGLLPEKDIFVAFSPEREDPGNAKFGTRNTPKVVGGESDASLELARMFYENVVENVVPVSSAATAEAVKITENVFRAVNIALVNELKVIYDAMGLDVWEVIDAAATKPFGFMPFYPGPGLGGHCIPIDPFYLTWKAREYGLSTRFIELAGEINVNMPHYVIAQLRTALDQRAGLALSKSRILVVGISYKKNVPDMRESPSVQILDLLRECGAETDYFDPLVPRIPSMREYPHLLDMASIREDEISARSYDGILIATDHDVIDYKRIAEVDAVIVDTRNVFARNGLPMHRVTKA
ncbi:MAG: nucleotide sugar dehydrogenase [Pseudomonadota bacterium]